MNSGNWRQLVLRGITEAYALARSGSMPRAGLRVLMYHSVGSVLDSSVGDEFSVSPETFAAQMTELASWREARVARLGDPLPAGGDLRVAITFDDGYQDNLQMAAPVLVALGIPFTVFVATSYVSRGGALYLTPDQVRQLAATPGATIGAHSVSHVPLTECTKSDLANELCSSKRYLEDLLGMEVTTMSYPYGAVDARVKEAALQAGYTLGVTTRCDINSADRDPLLLCRTPVLAADDMRTFGHKLRGGWDWYGRLSRDPVAA